MKKCQDALFRLIAAVIIGGLLANPSTGQSIQIDKELDSKIVQYHKDILGVPSKSIQENLLRIIETNPDSLVMESKNQIVRASWACQVLLLGTDLGSMDFKRKDSYFNKQFETAKLNNNMDLMQDIARKSLFTNSGIDACIFLGDKAFEESKIEEAENWWNLPLALRQEAEKKLKLAKPIVFAQLPILRARLVAASLARDGNGQNARERFESFSSEFPNNDGIIASKNGNMVKALETLSKSKIFPPLGASWGNYALNKERNPIISHGPSVYELANRCANPPTWKISIYPDAQDNSKENAPRNIMAPLRSPDLSFHPLRVGSRILFQDGFKLVSFDIVSGNRKILYEPKEQFPILNSGQQSRLERKMALTFSAPDKILVAFDYPAKNKETIIADSNEDISFAGGVLACLELNAAGSQLLWQARQSPVDQVRFESDPLVHDGKVYILASQRINGRESLKVLCYNLDSNQPDLLWTCIVSGESTPVDSFAGKQSFLTLAGNNLLSTSMSGALTAIDHKTGKIVWVRPSQQIENSRGIKSSVAVRAIFHEATIYHLDLKSRSLQALDNSSGALIWSREIANVDQLIAVKDGILLLGTGNGLRALNSTNGLDNQAWSIPSDGSSLPSAGRGFVLGNNYIWPTVKGVFVVDLKTGMPAADLSLFHRLQPGNLFLFDECLLSVDRNAIRVYVGAKNQKPNVQKEPLSITGPQVRKNRETSSKSDDIALVARPAINEVKWTKRLISRGESFQPGEVQIARESKVSAITQGLNVKVVRNSDGFIIWDKDFLKRCNWVKILGEVLFLGFNESLLALDLEKGGELWHFKPLISGNQTVFEFSLSGDKIFCHDGSWKVYCLDSTGGNVIFERYFPIIRHDFLGHRLQLSKLLEIDHAFILPDTMNNYWCLRAGVSRPTLVPKIGNANWETMVRTGDNILALNSDGELCLLEPKNFDCVSRYPLVPASMKTGKPGSILVKDNRVVVGIECNVATALFLFDLVKGMQVWEKPLLIFDKGLKIDAWRIFGDSLLGFADGSLKSWGLDSLKETCCFNLPVGFKTSDWKMDQAGKYLVAWASPTPGPEFTFKVGPWEITRNADGIYPKGKGMPMFFLLNGDSVKDIHLETYAGGARWNIRNVGEFHLMPGIEMNYFPKVVVHQPKVLVGHDGLLVGLASEVYSLAP